MLRQPDLQLRTLHLYGEFLSRRASWSHTLTLAAFEGAADTGLAAASTLAGATSLTIDSDAALVKAHLRDGAFDFVVNTLDEALRAIKNEIRQGRALAIGLIGSPAAILEEASERGLAPDFTLSSDPPTQTGVAAWLGVRDWHAATLPPNALDFPDPIRRNFAQNLPTLQRSARSSQRVNWLTSAELATLPR